MNQQPQQQQLKQLNTSNNNGYQQYPSYSINNNSFEFNSNATVNLNNNNNNINNSNNKANSQQLVQHDLGLNEKLPSLNESILQPNDNSTKVITGDNTIPLVDDSATLFTPNTYGENDVDMVQEIINDMIQKEDLKKDNNNNNNTNNNSSESMNKPSENSVDQSKKETELFLSQSILTDDMDVAVNTGILPPAVKNVDLANDAPLLTANNTAPVSAGKSATSENDNINSYDPMEQHMSSAISKSSNEALGDMSIVKLNESMAAATTASIELDVNASSFPGLGSHPSNVASELGKKNKHIGFIVVRFNK